MEIYGNYESREVIFVVRLMCKVIDFVIDRRGYFVY